MLVPHSKLPSRSGSLRNNTHPFSRRSSSISIPSRSYNTCWCGGGLCYLLLSMPSYTGYLCECKLGALWPCILDVGQHGLIYKLFFCNLLLVYEFKHSAPNCVTVKLLQCNSPPSPPPPPLFLKIKCTQFWKYHTTNLILS